MKKIIKGNLDSGGYSIRITEDNGDHYYYNVIILENGKLAIFGPGNPFNIRGSEEVLWKDLPIKIRETHYKNMYPNGIDDDFQKKCYLYGEQEARKMEEIAEKKKEEERKFYEKIATFPVDSYICKKIYEAIGTFKKIVEIRKIWISGGEYLVDDRWYIKIKDYEITSIKEKSEAKKEKAEWGKRVRKFAKIAGTSYDLATVVGNIPDDAQAVKILKQIKECLSNFDQDEWGNIDIKRKIRYKLIDMLSSPDFKSLNFSKKFYIAAMKILSSN